MSHVRVLAGIDFLLDIKPHSINDVEASVVELVNKADPEERGNDKDMLREGGRSKREGRREEEWQWDVGTRMRPVWELSERKLKG